jgi:DnaA family protein
LSQLALPLKLQDHAVFDSFLPGSNEPVVVFLEETVDRASGPGGWLWGAASTGKSHLLQAVCARAGDRAQFVPLAEILPAGPGILDDLDSRQFVCLDDIDRVAGKEDWEFALFSLVNAITDRGGVLIGSATAPPRDCAFELADLQSRFARLTVFQLHSLDDAERIAALQLRAGHRGLDLPTDTANYLVTRRRRDMTSLYALLDRLDNEALRAQRRLTIPFVRDVLRKE